MEQRTKVLIMNNKKEIPVVGLGTWQLTERGPLLNALEKAYEIGYRHIDTASRYTNEKIIGEFVAKNDRSSLFITSKLWNTDHDHVEKACRQSLEDLQTDYVDLYLVHFPYNAKGELKLKELWRDMESLVEKGLARSIGVSNFGVKRLNELLSFCKIVPAVNQIELHPYLPQFEVCKLCEEKGITIVSYSTLGSSGNNQDLVREDPVVCEIAKKYGVSPAKILLSYAVSRGCCVIPRSCSEEHLRDNFELIKLAKDDMDSLNSLEKRVRYNRCLSFGSDVFD